MNFRKDNHKNELKDYYILWSTQSLSQLGSSMTAFALTLWLYEKTGSALSTAANLDVILRNTIPVELQGRVYACRNTLQFFTIPIGLFLGGLMVDQVCEPFMAKYAENVLLTTLFGSGKGSGAALMMFLLAVTGTLACLAAGSRLKQYKYSDN